MNVAMRAGDALGDRLTRLRVLRREPGWAEELLRLGRELTLAEAGAVVARGAEGWTAISPEGAGPLPEAWLRLAEAATGGRAVAAAATGRDGRWVFAAAIGPADPPGDGVRPGALLLEVGSAVPMDLVLTRERMAFLGALAEAAAGEAFAHARAPLALAAAAAEALLRAPDRARGLHQAAAAVAGGGLQGAERVAIILPRRREVGLSDQAQVEIGADLPRALLALANEAIDRGAARLALAGEAPSPAERGFADACGARPLGLVPGAGGRAVVVVVFAPGAAPAAEALERLAPVAALLGAVGEAPARAQGPRRRWVIGLAMLALGGLAALPRVAVVEAPVVLRPDRAQLVTAPFDGILEASAVQPGDSVEDGATPLARMATREVELELAAARARAANDLRDAAVARAAGQPAQEQISFLSARRAEAQVALLEHRLRLADIRAPADGVIVAGDLRRSLGQPLSRGQILFEIALPGPLRAEVLVLDADVAGVRQGQAVRFATAAEPGMVRAATVERVRPMAEVVEGRNVFRVVARIEEDDAPALRPGMEGWARIETGRTIWLLAMLRDPVRWVRRQFWI